MLFYATGVIPMYVYNGVQRAVAGAVNSNRGLLSYPVVALIDAVIAKFLLNILTLSVVAVILLTSIILYDGLHVNIDPARFAAGFLMAALLGLGVGSVNCVLFGFFPTWKNVWNVLSRPLFFISGVLFLYEVGAADLPAHPVVEPAHPHHRPHPVRGVLHLQPDLHLHHLRARRLAQPLRHRWLAAAPPRRLAHRAVTAPAEPRGRSSPW